MLVKKECTVSVSIPHFYFVGQLLFYRLTQAITAISNCGFPRERLLDTTKDEFFKK